MNDLERAIKLVGDEGEGDDPQYLVYKGVLYDLTKPLTEAEWEILRELVPEKRPGNAADGDPAKDP